MKDTVNLPDHDIEWLQGTEWCDQPGGLQMVRVGLADVHADTPVFYRGLWPGDQPLSHVHGEVLLEHIVVFNKEDHSKDVTVIKVLGLTTQSVVKPVPERMP